MSLVGAQIAQLAGPPLIGAVVGGVGAWFLTDQLCDIIHEHRYLVPIMGALSGGAAAVLIANRLSL